MRIHGQRGGGIGISDRPVVPHRDHMVISRRPGPVPGLPAAGVPRPRSGRQQRVQTGYRVGVPAGVDGQGGQLTVDALITRGAAGVAGVGEVMGFTGGWWSVGEAHAADGAPPQPVV